MAPKKDKAKKEDEKGGAFNEVERTFLELQLTDSNRKVARLRTAVEEYEVRLEELQKAYDKLDEDRADIIAYLKKMLTVKNEENNELKEKVKGLEEIRDIENARFNETTKQLEKDFMIMKEQLTSENKLLAGKLNTLEEFRAIRDDLMRKFENQEQEFKDQEMKYKRLIYDTEKKFIVSKDNLKKEMEARLLQLAQDFQDATELRVAASTHRVIRENITINNELESVLSTQRKLSEQNEHFKESMKAARVSQELAEEERDKAISKSIVQLKVIEQLTAAYEAVKKEKCLFERKSYDFEVLQAKIERLTNDNNNMSQQVRVLEQNLHARLSDQNKAVVDAAKMTKERDKLRKILKEAAFAIQAALKLDEWASMHDTREVMDRHVLLSHLLEIISQFRELEHSESLGTIGSFSKVYEEGDLGFVPKPKIKKSSTDLAGSAIPVPEKEVSQSDVEVPTTESLSQSTKLSSIQTIPSIKVIPSISKKDLVVTKSDESLIASESETIEEEESMSDKMSIAEQLAASKIEMQKSLMDELMYTMQSHMKLQMAQEERTKSQMQLPTADDDESKEIEEKEIAVVTETDDVELGDEDKESEISQDVTVIEKEGAGEEVIDDKTSDDSKKGL
ncbi:hypothetical protein PYW08_003023 [Mythimna loreyi]|uniref:Uncharacterized protein n=1 Tax=Mythimna loreyi TaxID=667449 RepID=A0ACC2QQE8_9NEOP|nr:hypothetical protein PYW08_003023 [Mythimna loreyi]